MNLRPLGDRVIVKAMTKEEKTASGIILPDTVESDANKTINTACQLIGARDIALPTGSVHVMLDATVVTTIPSIFTTAKRMLKSAA